MRAARRKREPSNPASRCGAPQITRASRGRHGRGRLGRDRGGFDLGVVGSVPGRAGQNRHQHDARYDDCGDRCPTAGWFDPLARSGLGCVIRHLGCGCPGPRRWGRLRRSLSARRFLVGGDLPEVFVGPSGCRLPGREPGACTAGRADLVCNLGITHEAIALGHTKRVTRYSVSSTSNPGAELPASWTQHRILFVPCVQSPFCRTTSRYLRGC
jgi:hypothetical protein